MVPLMVDRLCCATAASQQEAVMLLLLRVLAHSTDANGAMYVALDLLKRGISIDLFLFLLFSATRLQRRRLALAYCNRQWLCFAVVSTACI
jgi:hypothetical protein